MFSGSVVIFSPCICFLRLGQQENEYLLLTIKTDGSGVVIVKPDFNNGKEPYRQVEEHSNINLYPIISTCFKTSYDLQENE